MKDDVVDDQEKGTGWLNMGEACELLGVAPSTIRRWAAAGRLKLQRTPGGHRRFDGEQLLALARSEGRGLIAGTTGEMRFTSLPYQPWHASFTPEVSAEMRGLGQRLLGLLIQYLVREHEDKRFITDGHSVGAGYGQMAKRAGINLHDTVEAFFYFRASFWQLALEMPSVARASDALEMRRVYERLDRFMNEVLLGTIDGYSE